MSNVYKAGHATGQKSWWEEGSVLYDGELEKSAVQLRWDLFQTTGILTNPYEPLVLRGLKTLTKYIRWNCVLSLTPKSKSALEFAVNTSDPRDALYVELVQKQPVTLSIYNSVKLLWRLTSADKSKRATLESWLFTQTLPRHCIVGLSTGTKINEVIKSNIFLILSNSRSFVMIRWKKIECDFWSNEGTCRYYLPVHYIHMPQKRTPSL